MEFQPRLAITSNTIAECSSDIGHFLVVYAEVIVLFSAIGNLAFGAVIPDFSSMWLSIVTWAELLPRSADPYRRMFSWNLGNFSTDVFFNEYPTVGPVYFLSYLILCYLILLNLFLAIVIDTWREQKDLTSLLSESVVTQLKRIFVRQLRVFRSIPSLFGLGECYALSVLAQIAVAIKARDSLNPDKDYPLLFLQVRLTAAVPHSSLQSRLKAFGMPKQDAERVVRQLLRKRRAAKRQGVNTRELKRILRKLKGVEDSIAGSHGSDARHSHRGSSLTIKGASGLRTLPNLETLADADANAKV